MIKAYFKEVALGAEFGDTEPVVRKWDIDIHISTAGNWPDHLRNELNLIVGELNELINAVDILDVDSTQAHNFVIFIGNPSDYVTIEPSAQPYVGANYGLFWVYWDRSRINKGSSYIDPVRADTQVWQKHLLREELTQALGLMNDSDKYDDSIFFQGRSYTTSYTDLDKNLIRLLYHEDIKPGMTWAEAEPVLSRLLEDASVLD